MQHMPQPCCVGPMLTTAWMHMQLIWFFAGATIAAGSPTFAASYGDHMVLQQAPFQAVVWGFAPAKEALTLTLLNTRSNDVVDMPAELTPFNSTAFTWRVVLPATASGNPAAPHTLILHAGPSAPELASLHDVLFGEVWVCSGQSNMAFLTEMAFDGPALVQDANNHPEIRFFTTRKLIANTPLQELGQATNKGRWTRGVELPWSIASNISISDNHHVIPRISSSVGDDNWLYMSAVCYIFGKSLQAARKVPVGLINTNWGGTRIENWCPVAALASCYPAPIAFAHLFNAMVSPLLNHTIKGVVWYQGESNGGEPEDYSCLLPALVTHWRAAWAAGSKTDPMFPFGVVQLAGDLGNDTLALPKFRFTGQTQDTGVLPNDKIPNSFLATTYDLGDSTSPFGSVHCRYKKEVGERLALGARRVAYAESVHSGPAFETAAIKQGSDGSLEVAITFRDIGAGGLSLATMNISQKYDQTNWMGNTPFEVCHGNASVCGPMGGFDGWSAPSSTALGTTRDTITLSGIGSRPMALRFAWRGYPCEHLGCGVYSKTEGIPPPPFHAWLNTSIAMIRAYV